MNWHDTCNLFLWELFLCIDTKLSFELSPTTANILLFIVFDIIYLILHLDRLPTPSIYLNIQRLYYFTWLWYISHKKQTVCTLCNILRCTMSNSGFRRNKSFLILVQHIKTYYVQQWVSPEQKLPDFIK